ncbi:MAG: non-ribosomal peptide synthetase, partial [Acidobacteriia bacterium]|nr:non-ribosomal peptide synthetase [Terriglobia bacterium]
RRAVEGLPGCKLINGYGPTETTTFACCHTIAPEDLDGRAIPIGRPIHRTEVHLLDSERRPVADGEDGEIFIGGDGLACGYLHQPEMTAARFVTHPLAGEPSNRLYRTGDIGRRREDGTIEFRGRLDDQVKISGHRIEPAEIQAALSQLPGVREAEVVAIAVNSQEKRLVAYVVPAKNGEAGAATVRQQLSQRLPDFMIPSVFQVVEELPISPNGKVDRAKLPAPHWEKGTGAVPAEGGNVESIVRAVWQKVLRVAEFGANENFFDLGGNSLMLIEAHAELERALGRELSLITLFEYPSVAALVPQMEGRSATHSTLRAAEQRARRQREALHRIRRARCGVGADQ